MCPSSIHPSPDVSLTYSNLFQMCPSSIQPTPDVSLHLLASFQMCLSSTQPTPAVSLSHRQPQRITETSHNPAFGANIAIEFFVLRT
ncbi:hypothetical protein J6590_054058 [Homalodisca vitripennis]|nr:hypothetical protein J6590_054058 [Homalodisca vitripennis]